MNPSQTLCILGRQPSLGLAELESMFGAAAVRPLNNATALLDVDPSNVPFASLGGVIKIGKLLHIFDSTNWRDIHEYLVKVLPEHLKNVPEGKLTIGLSAYGLDVHAKKLLETALSLKKIAKQSGQSVRIVPNKTSELNSAQVLHNKLYTPNGWELVFVSSGGKTYMSLTTAVQDIEAYAARDQARPKRDARVGMLPPKLAQIIINLSVGSITKGSNPPTVLDPFCGTGVILQEAKLMGLNTCGSDLEPKMVEYSEANLEWLNDTSGFKPTGATLSLETADATNHTWPSKFDYIACETYLGRAFSSNPTPEVLKDVMQDTHMIHKRFLQNVAAQTKPGFRLCIAVPAWFIGDQVKHLKTLDSLEEMGYTRVSFVHADDMDLIYHRQGQIVGRELVVLTRT